MLALIGCGAGIVPASGTAGAPAPAAPPTAAAPTRDPAVPEPHRPAPQKPPAPRDPWRLWASRAAPLGVPPASRAAPLGPLLVEPAAPVVLPPLERGLAGRERREPAGDIQESELWVPCVRDFVRARPEPARRALTAALARYQTTCGPDGGVVLLGVLGLDGRERRGRSDVGFTDTLSASRTDVSLRVASCDGPLAAERIAIAADGARWSSPRIAFAQDQYGCEVAVLPWTRALARAVWAAAGAADAVIAFEGGGQDLAITDEMKQHLRAMLEALDALDALDAPTAR